MKPGDLIRSLDRFWEVEEVHLGAENQESLISLRSIGVRPASFETNDPKALICVELSLVPERLLNAAITSGAVGLYTRVNKKP